MLQKLHNRIDIRLREELSPRRYRHSIAVAEYARDMGQRLGVDAEHCAFAGLAHDLAREWPAQRLLRVATDENWQLDELERANPLLLHGRAAAYVLQQEFNIEQEDILLAICHHTLGHPDLGPVGKVLFCADYLSPDRTRVEQSFRLAVSNMTLDGTVVAVIEHAREHRLKMAELTLAFAARLRAGSATGSPGGSSGRMWSG